GDYDGDGRDDVFWYGPGAADDYLWKSTGRGFVSRARPVSGHYAPVVVDATADGRSDIVWVQPGATTSARWDFAADTTYTGRVLTTPAPGSQAYPGDFDGDGRGDVLVYGKGTEPDAVWYSTPTGVSVRTVSVKGTYGVATGPMDLTLGTVTSDVLFASLGSDTLWLMRTDRTHVASAVG
ncbi:MAG: FG-GAP-like repeat-containing protein, partial [Acidimicrobiales bacterium]